MLTLSLICYLFALFHFQAEARAEFAERTVARLLKEVDKLEGKKRKRRKMRTSSSRCSLFICFLPGRPIVS